MRTVVMALAVLVLLAAQAAPAAAQSFLDPAVEHVEGKSQDAQADPLGFVGDHADPDAVRREADWSHGYACFAAREASREAGLPPPDLPHCPAFENVHEVEEEVEDVAEVIPLDPVVGEAEALLANALDTLDEVAAEPTNALAALLGFLGRTLAAASRILDVVLSAIGGLVGGIVAGTLVAGAALFEGVVWLFTAPVRLSTQVSLAAWDAASHLGRGISAGVESAMGALVDAIGSLFESPEAVSEAPAPGLSDASKTVDDGTERLLETVTGLVEA